jgi:hypothetical protein
MSALRDQCASIAERLSLEDLREWINYGLQLLRRQPVPLKVRVKR